MSRRVVLIFLLLAPLLAPARPGKKRARAVDAAAAANGENGHRRPKRAFSADL